MKKFDPTEYPNPAPYHTKLLICGSRNMVEGMDFFVEQMILYAKEKDWVILCGDARGVDYAVQEYASFHNMPFMVYSPYKKPRNYTGKGKTTCMNYLYRDYGKKIYWWRDQLMAYWCDICYALWSGLPDSKGTILTYNEAVRLEKIAGLRNFQTNEVIKGEIIPLLRN